MRSSSDRMIAGVAGGLARTFGVDPVLFRVVLAVLALAGGSGLLLYLLLWLLIPSDDSEGVSVADRWVRSRSWSTATVLVLAVVVAVAVGVIVGLDPTPLIVLAVVAVIIFLLVRRDPRPPNPAAGPVHYGPAAPPQPYATQPYATQPYATQPYATQPYATQPYAAQPTGAEAGPGGAGDPAASQTAPTQELPMTSTYAAPPDAGAPPPPPYAPYAAPPPPAAPKPPRERSVLGVVTLGLAAVTAGVLVAIRLASGEHTPTATAILASTALVVGIGLLVGTFVGRARWLVIPGVLLLLLTAGSSAAHRLDGPRGDRTYAPTSVSQVQSSYDWGTGRLTLDLTQVQGDPDLTVAMDLGAGSLRVIVPEDATIEGTARAGVGSVRIDGFDVSDGFGNHVDLGTADKHSSSGTQTIMLDLRVGLGEVVVSRA